MITSTKLKRQSDITDTYAIWDGIEQIYRYVLYREWNNHLSHMVIIGLNPSAADEEYDDRTVRRCINFARREGCGSLSMLNAFALRATNPSELLKSNDPIGIENDEHIWTECFESSKIVIAWGTHGKLLNRQERMLKILKGKTLYCFGTNKDGTPKHPLYLGNNTKLEIFKG
jgi:hypothetical protein